MSTATLSIKAQNKEAWKADAYASFRSAPVGERECTSAMKRRLSDQSGNDSKQKRYCLCGCGKEIPAAGKRKYFGNHRITAFRKRAAAPAGIATLTGT